MNIYQLISNAIKDRHVEFPTKPVNGICAVTGERGLCVSRKKLFSSNFTEQPNLQCPGSQEDYSI